MTASCDGTYTSFGNPANPNLRTIYDNLVAMYDNGQPNMRNMLSCALFLGRVYKDLPKVQPTSGSNIGGSIAKYGGASLGTTSAVAGAGWLGGTAASTGLAGGSIAGVSAAAATGIGALVILPFAVWGIVSAHHKQAVAKEQSAIASAGAYFDSNNAAVIQAVTQNQIGWKDAKGYFDAILKESLGVIAPVSGINGPNAGTMYGQVYKALHDLYIILYATPGQTTVPIDTPAAQTKGPTATNAQYNPSGASGVPTAALAGAAGLGLHFAGVF